jgi:hypothetical protein
MTAASCSLKRTVKRWLRCRFSLLIPLSSSRASFSDVVRPADVAVRAMDTGTRKAVALRKGWPAEVVLASLKMERAEKKGDTEAAVFWYEVRDYVMQRGCVVEGTPNRLFHDWQKWPGEPWRDTGLGWRGAGGERRRSRD